jgi:hypothetical protein
VAGNLYGHRIGNHLARLPLKLYPGGMGKSNPNRPSVRQKLDVNRIGVARGNGHNQCLINTADLIARPAIGNLEVFIHGQEI